MAKRELPESIGNYKIVRELGRGSMGTVYLGMQESLGRQVAIKVLALEFTRDEEFLERFKREGRTAGTLRHPNIVQVFDQGESSGYYYIIMEYVGPVDLKRLLQERGGKLPLSQAVAFVDQILSALDHAHAKGIVHRDVKPANILISDQGTAVLTDFSVAHMKYASRLTQTGAAVGTPEYMAPEQFDGKDIDGRADLYALGIILYEMLTGVQPFHAETMAEVMKSQLFRVPPDVSTLDPSIPADLTRLVARALEKKKENRFPSAAAMLEALRLLRGVAEEAKPDAYLERFLAAVAGGSISLDDANLAREKVKQAIDDGYRKNLTIMMVDLAGSSKIKVPNETLQADRAFRDYRATINDLLKKHEATSFDWSGDGAICIFQQPLPAVRAAVDIQAMVEQVAQRHPQLPDKLRARIGINTGEVYLDPRRSLGEFASRTVDQAGHLEKDCPVGGVHVSQSTMEACRGEFDFEAVGLNRDQVMVYRVVLPAPAPALAPAPAPAAPKLALGKPEPASAPQPRFCPGCAQPVVPGHRHCSNCGFEVGSLVGRKEDTPSASKPQVSLAPEVSVPEPKSTSESPAAPSGSQVSRPAKTGGTLVGKSTLAHSPPPTPDSAPSPRRTEPDPEVEPRLSAGDTLDLARKILGVSGLLCFCLSLLYFRYPKSNAAMAFLIGGLAGVPSLAAACLVVAGLEIVWARRIFGFIQSLAVFVGLAAFGAILWHKAMPLWR